jgi:histone deacetylase 6
METFQEKVPSPGNLVREVEAHQAAVATRKTGDVSHKAEADEEEDEESAMEEEPDWTTDSIEDSKLLPISSLPTGLCYDIRMRYHCEVRPTLDVHPEDPRRIYYIYRELCKAGLVDDPESTRPLVNQPLLRIPARDATEEEIALVHDRAHYAFVRSTQGEVFLFQGLHG